MVLNIRELYFVLLIITLAIIAFSVIIIANILNNNQNTLCYNAFTKNGINDTYPINAITAYDICMNLPYNNGSIVNYPLEI